jgi:nickel-dependent lactate racemase
VNEVSEGLISDPIDVEVNNHILNKSYDLIISIGQVVPHEVVGMANYSKNIFVGCGGSNMINQSHMLGAFYGLERIMGRDFSPVRKVFDYAEENFINDVPLMYVLTVTTQVGGKVILHGLFIGRNRKLFEEAVKLSQEKNLIYVEKPLKKVVVYLDEREFKSTWLGNKAIYRTRMAIEDGGELIILAPGVKKFGEDDRNDELIRKYGYIGRKNILELVKKNEDLKGNLSVAAHLIHGSTDGRFEITYAVEKLTREEIEQANFKYEPLSEAYKKYNPAKLKDGFNTLPNGEEIFYISNPALGLWACKDN